MKELKESKIQEILQGNTESLNTEFKATLNSQGPSLRDRPCETKIYFST